MEVSSPHIASDCCPPTKLSEDNDALPIINPEGDKATKYGKSEDIGRLFTTPDVKNMVIFTSVFPTNSGGKIHSE